MVRISDFLESHGGSYLRTKLEKLSDGTSFFNILHHMKNNQGALKIAISLFGIHFRRQNLLDHTFELS